MRTNNKTKHESTVPVRGSTKRRLAMGASSTHGHKYTYPAFPTILESMIAHREGGGKLALKKLFASVRCGLISFGLNKAKLHLLTSSLYSLLA